MTTAVIAEKPSVARDIAAALGVTGRRENCFEGNGYLVTWAIGHLVALAQPHEIDPAWKRWSLFTLPMLPRQFPLVVLPDTSSQFATVKRVMLDRSVTRIVCATDAGREGELIFRYIYEAAGCKKPVSRLWISSLTREAILDGFSRLRSGAEFDDLADAARGRSRADWLVGMNLSRAYSLVLDQDISVGRVQTPTLGILVARELAIRDFVPEDYREVVARFQPRVDATPRPGAYEGTWFRPPAPGEADDEPAKRKRLPADGIEAAAIVARAFAGQAAIASHKAETRKIPPPLLYDLTDLQRHANRLYGMSAQKTLDVAQALYERHKLISYPRTDSRHLSTAIAATLEGVAAAVSGRYPGLLAPGTGQRPLGRRFVDDARVTDHHAILPTAKSAHEANLTALEQKIYDLICRRLLAAWHDDYVYSATTVITTITTAGEPTIVDHYESRGTAVQQPGWKVLEVGHGKPASKSRSKTGGAETSEADPGDQALPAGLARGQPQQVLAADIVEKQTRPPPRHTEATLLTAMETAGRTLEEKELSDAMRDLGLGTPATRAQIIETLLRREYVVRDGKALAATEKGIHLISVVHPDVKSPAMTGEWEAKLKRMSRGDGDLPTFMAAIESFVSEVVDRVTTGGQPLPPPPGPAREQPPPAIRSKPRREPPGAPPPASADPSQELAGDDFAAPPTSRRRASDSGDSPPASRRKSAARSDAAGDGRAAPAARRDDPGEHEETFATSEVIAPASRRETASDRFDAPPATAPRRKTASDPGKPASAPASRFASASDLFGASLANAPPQGSDAADCSAVPASRPAATGDPFDSSPASSPHREQARDPAADRSTVPTSRRGATGDLFAASPASAPRREHERDTAARTSRLAATGDLFERARDSAEPSTVRTARGTTGDLFDTNPVPAPRRGRDSDSAERPPAPAAATDDLFAATTSSRRKTASERAAAPPASASRRATNDRTELASRPGPTSARLDAPTAPHDIPASASRPRPASEPSTSSPRRSADPESPLSAPADLRALLRARFGFPDFRPYQEAVCRTATLGRDLLLVMPTGAGKSLCYQLPGIARGGTTLVISPLIALMEDQAGRLSAQGFRAERIHSGRSRTESRQACLDYLAGKLDFLFIAPERLRVPGFPEMLARRTPALVAVDEAHCISQWGHDFRPDYRMLGQRLPALRPAPIIALTATATPTVQDDIVAQLGLRDAGRFIHGFRRTNIAIEVIARNPGERADAICELLSERARRPAIVYAATRKSAEELAQALGPRLAAAYHAGMGNEDRDRVQSAFLAGQREIIVATTAFGMGIDKADVRTIVHAALPGSLEGYYQEIGRAGRDGGPARAVLFHAYVDRKTHEFFHERDYPEPRAIEAIFTKLPRTPTARAAVNKRRSRAGREAFERALEKLLIHGGAIEANDEISKGAPTWKAGYAAQREHKQLQLEGMARFAEGHGCRMVRLIRHFGDQEDRGEACGICDACAPDRCIAQEYRAPSPSEQVHVARLLAALSQGDSQATGRLHRETFPDDEIDRRSFEHLLGGLVAAGLVTLEEASFTKRGKAIPFQRATLTPAGKSHDMTVAGLKLPKAAAAKKSKATTSRRRAARPAVAKRKTAKRKTTKRKTTTKRKRAPASDD
ncbi:DNA topoisomerase 3 [Nannocystis bainbridge]|uniref:ATP-dependent DNA helicase RecQ n=1 Tax=Nannocystis bainbridge TaxID=2995303 RepID=A0ABT5E3V0_9BACT|nr:DNA topoisomerase 3 [Nannocystis bainbridge]MDC0720516.1 DNA topoisomerase 3 [Nannocystis bainbridge]